MRVLVSDGSYKHTLGIVRDLGMRGLEVFVCSDVRPAIAGMSRYCRGHFLVPDTAEDTYPIVLQELIWANRIDLYIPVGYKSCLAAATNRERFSAHCRLFILDEQTIRSAADKMKMTALAQELGIAVPQSFVPGTVEEAVTYARQVKYPLVIKGRTEGSPFSPAYIRNTEQLDAVYHRLVDEHGLGCSELPMIQQRLTGGGFGFFAFYLEGEMQACFMHRRIREYPVSGGPSTCAESFADDRLLDCGKRLLDRMHWHGVAMVEFKQDRPGGDYHLLEVNPKFWGSHDLALHCGVSFPYMMVQTALGERLRSQPAHQCAVRFHWPLSGDFRGTLSRPKRLLTVLLDCLDPRVASNLKLTDLRPNLAEAVQTMLPKFLKRMLKAKHP